MNLEQYKAHRSKLVARMKEITAVAEAAGRTLGDDESAEINALDVDLASIDRTIRDAETVAAAVANARPVEQPALARVAGAWGGMSAMAPGGIRAAAPVAPAVLTKTTQAQRNGDRFAGETYTKYICARILQVANNVDLATITARHARSGRPEYAKVFATLASQGVEHRIRAANEVPAGGTGSGDWGKELVTAENYVGDFIDYLREKTVFDRLPLTNIPANVTIKGQDGTGGAFWVGEHKPIPMSAQDYSTVTLTPLKVGALSAISIELAEDGSPDALQLVAESLRRDSTQLIDSRFLSATAASAGVSPAGILNGLSAVGASAGTDLNGLITDQDALVQPFITAKNTGGLVYVARPGLAHKIGLFRSFAGLPIYPGLTEDGGTLDGKPFYVSDNAGSGDLLLVKPSDIYRIGDSGINLDISREATLEFASDPTGAGDATPVAQSKQPVNLFQSGMIGVRVLRRINWAKRRASAVSWIDDAAYVPQVQTA